MYSERASTVVQGAVLWTSIAAAETRVLPDGCMDIIWSEDELFVAGPDTTAHVHHGSPGTRLTGLRFAPGTAPLALGLPAHALADARASLDEIWPSHRARAIAARLQAALDPAAVLEAVAAERLAGERGAVAARAELTAAIRGGHRVTAIADRHGIDARQLHRLCRAAYGYGPKTLQRILRLQAALDLARRGAAFADIAATSGFADQAHLARDVKNLAGVPLGQLLAA